VNGYDTDDFAENGNLEKKLSKLKFEFVSFLVSDPLWKIIRILEGEFGLFRISGHIRHSNRNKGMPIYLRTGSSLPAVDFR
jgi:hypothetical protein